VVFKADDKLELLLLLLLAFLKSGLRYRLPYWA
jgi:hypothetical protein